MGWFGLFVQSPFGSLTLECDGSVHFFSGPPVSGSVSPQEKMLSQRLRIIDPTVNTQRMSPYEMKWLSFSGLAQILIFNIEEVFLTVHSCHSCSLLWISFIL